MATPKSLPARPSLESLRKQAKKLTRDVAAGDSEALSRVRAQLPGAEPRLSLRDAQLVLAREFGFAGWADLLAEVHKRIGNGLEWAATQARRAIHDNDLATLKQLLAERPALLAGGECPTSQTRPPEQPRTTGRTHWQIWRSRRSRSGWARDPPP